MLLRPYYTVETFLAKRVFLLQEVQFFFSTSVKTQPQGNRKTRRLEREFFRRSCVGTPTRPTKQKKCSNRVLISGFGSHQLTLR